MKLTYQISALEAIKSLAIFNGTLGSQNATFYNVINDIVDEEPVGEFSEHNLGQHRVAIKGNPNFGDIRALMVGVKNPRQDNMNVCAEVWFNEIKII